MKISKQTNTLAIIVVTCGLLLAACGSGGDTAITGTAQVTAADSPIPETTGVKTSLSDGTQVYLLSQNTNSDETKSMKIISDPNKTGGDTSELVGKTFLEFEMPNSQYEKVVINASASSRVFECDLQTRKCNVIESDIVNSNQISFDVEGGKFYAVKK